MTSLRYKNNDTSLLYVEDNKDTRDLIAEMITVKYPGLRLFVAPDGAVGLELFYEHLPDIVLTDMSMPIMDGLQMATVMRNVKPDTLLIAVTAHSDTTYFMRAIEIGFNQYVLKPVNFTKLYGALDACIAVVHQQKTLKYQQDHVRKLSAAVERSPCSVIITDNLGVIEYVNPRYCRVSGYASDDVIGRHLPFMQPVTLGGDTCDELWLTITTGQEWRGEIPTLKKNGEFLWEQVSIAPSVDESGAITNFIVITEDITGLKLLTADLHQANQNLESRVATRTSELITATERLLLDIAERKIVETELIKAKEAAEVANKTKDQFIANMSHELRTPMNGVLGMIQLTQYGELDAEQREYLKMAYDSGLSLVRIINDILDLTKLEEHTLTILYEPFSLRDCVADVLGILTPEATRKGLRMHSFFAEDMPEIIEGDRLRLQQVLTNLVGNAVKFTSQGEVTVTVSSTPENITITVKDTGIGIPLAKQNLLFKRFSQIDDSNTRRYGGIGLGLIISKEVVELMGGNIHLESIEGQGCTLSISIPVTRRETLT